VSNDNERTWGFSDAPTPARSLFTRPSGDGLGPPSTWCGNCAISQEETAMNRYIALDEEADWDEFAVDHGWMFEGVQDPLLAEGEVVMIDRSEDSDESTADHDPHPPEPLDAYNHNWDDEGRV